jgi:hypothetical protein
MIALLLAVSVSLSMTSERSGRKNLYKREMLKNISRSIQKILADEEEKLDDEGCFEAYTKAVDSLKPATDPDENDPNEGDPNEGDPNEGDPNEGDPNEGDPNEGDPNEGDPNEGDPNEGDPNEGDPNEGDPNEGDPNEGDPNEGDPNEGDPNEGDPNEGDPNERHRRRKRGRKSVTKGKFSRKSKLVKMKRNDKKKSVQKKGKLDKTKALVRTKEFRAPVMFIKKERLATKKNCRNSKLLASDDPLTTFAETCQATAAKEDCAALLTKLAQPGASDADKASFTNVCKVDAPSSGGDGRLNFSNNNFMLMITLALSSFYFII